MKQVLKQMLAGVAVAALFTACGGGGGSSGGGTTYTPAPTQTPNPPAPSGPAPVVYGPYENVYGDYCTATTAVPGCTFYKNSNVRITYTQDADYNKSGYGRDDLWYVKFDASGNANVYNDLGVFQYTRNISQFAGYISGTTIGVGTTGLYWENVANHTYWLGKNGVLYSAVTSNANFGQAINSHDAQESVQTSFATMNSEGNKSLVNQAAAKLVKTYGFTDAKAHVVASALNNWAVVGAQRGYTTVKDVDQTFKSVFGTDFTTALAAVHDLQNGDSSGMRDLTQTSANALGLKPNQAQAFIKGMYKKTLASYGVDVDAVNW